jgi:hypothetical protein
MNGERALAYVRARYIEGSEGGDFKRAARQQQVLLAVREKVFSYQTALDFGKMNAILNSLSNNIRTDLELWELKKFFELARLVQPDQVRSTVLSTGPQGVLVGETQVLGGVPASILKPRKGNYSEIQSIAANIFESSGEVVPPPVLDEVSPDQLSGPDLIAADNTTAEPSETLTDTSPDLKPTIEIRNTTNINGLASRFRDKLRNDDYSIKAIGNANIRDLPTTVVYIIKEDLTSGASKLAESMKADIQTGLPDGEAASEADALILLGNDQSE